MAIRTPSGLLRLAFATSLAALTLVLPEGAQAGCTTQTIGDTSFHHCDDGTSGTSLRVGDNTFHHFDGESGTSLKVGDTTFHHLDGKGLLISP